MILAGAAQVSVWVAAVPVALTVGGGIATVVLQGRQKQRTLEIAAAVEQGKAASNEAKTVLDSWHLFTVEQQRQITNLQNRVAGVEKREAECHASLAESHEKIEALTGVIAGMTMWANEKEKP